ncbi:MAG: hypothetical protein OXR71_03200 [Gemmatimonadota bacterium]|nr:hypothetical protein [Gemmatimonadota bacterium]
MMLPTLETRVADHETRISMLEAINDQISDRLSSMDSRLNSMDSGIRWIVGLQITMIITIATSAIAVIVKLG